jgi:hypothetical protein
MGTLAGDLTTMLRPPVLAARDAMMRAGSTREAAADAVVAAVRALLQSAGPATPR